MNMLEFRRLLANSEDEEAIKELVELDPDRSTPFGPAFRLKEGVLDTPDVGLESALLLNWANGFCRRVRNKQYRRRLKNGYNGIKIVSEGDSWFQYPFILDDVIDQLSQQYAIYSLGAGGDWLKDISDQDEFMQAIRSEHPDFFLVSGGGNDLVGNLIRVVLPFEEGRMPHEYLNAEFNVFVTEILMVYKKLFDQVRAEFPSLRILCHGYNYAIPNKGKWLGKPLSKKLNIQDSTLQEEILRVIMDRFNEALYALTLPMVGVHFIDCRDSFDRSMWYDELHPVDDGFELVANKFRAVLEN